MTGLIGWAVVVPTLTRRCIGNLAGQALSRDPFMDTDIAYHGLPIGCINAWHWVSMEEKSMREGADE